MNTLSYGFKKPQTGDKGSVFFPALEDDIQQLNDHTHNGVNSSKLSGPASATVVTQTMSVWENVATGLYRNLVTMPGTLKFDEVAMQWRNVGDEQPVYPKIVKVTANTYYIYMNTDGLTIRAVYSA